jgi:alkyl hydroperoxide reductase subunit F
VQDMGSSMLDLKLILPEEEQERISQIDEIYNIIIIGGGPAGMTSAVYAARKQIKTLMISKDIGGQLLWTSDIENYMGFQYISGKELTEKFRSQMEQFPIVDIILNNTVEKLEKADGNFIVTTTDSKKYTGKTIIIASGKRYRPMNASGEKELVGKGVSYCATCDAPLFAGKNVMVVGGGNSALTSVIDLMKLANKIYVVNIMDSWQADTILLEKTKDATNVEWLLSHRVTAIHGEKYVTGVSVESVKTKKVKDLNVQGVFVEIGLIPNSDFAKGFVLQNTLGEIVVDCSCQTNIPGVFASGDVTTVPDKQISIAIGEGSKAALSAYKYLLTKEIED